MNQTKEKKTRYLLWPALLLLLLLLAPGNIVRVPVSYTHLDVYKRQRGKRSGLRIDYFVNSGVE